MNEQRYPTKSFCALAAILFGLLLGRGDSAAAQQPAVKIVATDSVVANHPTTRVSLPAPYKVVGGGAQSCDQLFVKYDGSIWWWGAFGNCKRRGGPTDRNAIFECAWNQVPAGDKLPCLKERLLQTDQTRRAIDNVCAYNGCPGDCDRLVVKYDGSNWWWGAFGNCKRRGCPADRNAIFECAWNQVPASDKTACLRARLLQTDQTRRAIDEVAAYNCPPNICDQLVVKYDGSNWWWGAFGNCKKPGGPTDRNAIFECAWNQVPASDNLPCLRERLLQTDQTRRAIDEVVVYNNCDRLVVKYDGSNWWWGAFGNCKRRGGPTDRNAVFECAWNQVPADDRLPCLRARLLPTEQTRQGIDNVIAYNSAIANNFSMVSFTACPNPAGGCPEECDLPHDGSVPTQYFAPFMPQNLLDAPPPANQTFNSPPAHNIGLNEGRLRSDLRAVARVAEPLECSLHASAILYSRADVDPPTQARADLETAQAYADLSVTGHKAFAKFRRDLPNERYCQTLLTRPLAAGCPTLPAPPSAAGLISGCRKALDRAYKVANFLRAGQALRTASPWFTPNGKDTPAADLERQRKQNDRNALGWIAVSGEDDSPHRPVNVPSSDFPQYDIDVDVEAPLAAGSKTVTVRTRYTVAQSKAPAPATRPATGWNLAPDPAPTIAPDAKIILFIHGMDSRAEEADVITKSLFKLMANSAKNLVVISVDLPTSGYAENLDFERVSPLSAIGTPKLTTLPGPFPVPIPDFAATGRTPLLDFIEDFVVRFAEALDRRVPVKNKIIAVMGGSLGGNMTFRLGRRPNVPWLPNFIVWSPASIWDSLGEGSDITKHIGPRKAWESANDRGPRDAAGQLEDPNDLSPARAGRRQDFFGSWDKPIVPLLIPAQSQTWASDYYLCKQSSVAAARLERHETYDARFLAWRWRLGAEQLLYSHQTIDPVTNQPRYMSNHKPMLLACGAEDHVRYNDICGATQRTAPHMTMTPGKALFLDKTGHSLDNERRSYWAQQIVEFLRLLINDN
ncbi:MAG: hypothetical protein L0Z50_17890 [Verrucomicrobiales bacterium]|nr:hypothetical protein [Verrucomicrobiales bacterium]